MHYVKTTAVIGSLLIATVSASTPTSFEVPGSAPGTAAAPEVDTTTVFVTSTYRLTSAVTMSTTINSTLEASKTGYSFSSAESMTAPDISLSTTAGPTHVPVTLWDRNSTRIVFSQNSTTVDVPTGSPTNGASTIIITATVPSETAPTATPKDNTTSATASASASIEPSNNAGKIVGNTLFGMGVVAGFVALL